MAAWGLIALLIAIFPANLHIALNNVPLFGAEEGFGMPALEAMAHGLPVVAADRGALPEVLGNAGLLVDADDPDALSAAIARILDDAELRERMSRAGRERAPAFTWTASAATLLDVFRSATQHRRSQRR